MGRTMAKTVDFNKIRRRRRMRETAKRLTILAVIVVFVGLVFLVNSLLVEEKLSTRVGDWVESWGGSGYPVDLPGGVIRDTEEMGKNLVILNDNNLFIYNNKGKIVTNIQQMTEKTVMDANDRQVLTFDVGSKKYQLHSPSRTIEKETENAILAADINAKGYYALVTAPRQFVAEVAVYRDPAEAHIFRWSSPEHHIAGVSLSPDGSRMAVSCAATEGGMMKTIITLFQLNMAEKAAEIELPNSLALKIDFYANDRIGVLTDKEYVILDTAGKRVASYDFVDERIVRMESYDRAAMLLTEYREARHRQVIFLDRDGSAELQMDFEESVRDIAMDKRYLYVLTDTGITCYNYAFKEVKKLEERGIQGLQVVQSKVYYYTAEELHEWRT